jgi:transcription initiation factor TFIIIB Brf1 subunit/transcription initiation factor TFIIB
MLEHMLLCEECGSKLVEEKGYLVCSGCGLAQQRILEGSEIDVETSSKKHTKKERDLYNERKRKNCGFLGVKIKDYVNKNEKDYEILEAKIKNNVNKKDVLSIEKLVNNDNEDLQYHDKRFMNIIVNALVEINTEQSIESLVRYYQNGCISSSEILEQLAEMRTDYVVKSLGELIIEGFGEDMNKIASIFRKKDPEYLLDIIQHQSGDHEHWIPSILKEFISNKDFTIIDPLLYSILAGYDYSFMVKKTLNELEEVEWFKQELKTAIQSLEMVSANIRKDFVPLFQEILPDLNYLIAESVDELIKYHRPVMKTRFRTILSFESAMEKNENQLEELVKVQQLIKEKELVLEIRKQIVTTFDIMTKQFRIVDTSSLTKKGYELYQLNQHKYFYMSKPPYLRKYYAELLLEYREKGNNETRELKRKLYSFYLQKKPRKTISGEIIFLLQQIQITIEDLEEIIDET